MTDTTKMREEPWHAKEEEFLTKIEKQCNAYSSYFNKDYQYYHTLSSRFNIPILIISSLNALCAISLNDFLGQRYVSILNAVLSAGTGVLGSVQLYMKINEKMANALRSGMLMKRLALKISKELSIDREQRATEGVAFLQDCFSEFNAALEQANPIEKKLNNFLSLGIVPPEVPKIRSFMDLASAAVARMSPRKSSLDESEIPDFTSGRMMPLALEPRAKTLLGLISKVRTNESSPPESMSPPNRTASNSGEATPEGPVLEP
jgi:hypothetical protein